MIMIIMQMETMMILTIMMVIIYLYHGFQTSNNFYPNHLGNHACHDYGDDHYDYANGDDDDLDHHDGDDQSISWFSNKQSFSSEPYWQSCLS